MAKKTSHETASRRTNDARLGFRLDPQTKQLIERAAELEHRKLTDYCLNALTEAARQTIEHHESLVLTERERKIFFDALVNPPQANDRLRRAFEAERNHIKR